MKRRTFARRLVSLMALMLACSTPARAAEQRVALVVGVSAYRNVPALTNTVSDARAMGAALTRLGFQVETLLDPDRAGFEAAVRNFGQRARGADASLFFYAGHALELGGRNWLIPATANLKTDRDLRFETMELDAILEQTDGASRVSLVFLDSCRDNPFKLQLTTATRDVPRGGLGQVRAASGTLVAFSTAPGTVAEDGKGAHSPFTSALLKWIEAPGIEVRHMLSEVRREVREATRGRQVPWENSALEGQFYFHPTAVTATAPGPPSATRPDMEALFWDSVRGSRDPAEYRAYLTQFPNGSFAELARGRIAQLEAATRTAATPAAPSAFRTSLLTGLAAAVPDMAAPVRDDKGQQYLQAEPNKALAVFSQSPAVWRTQRWETPELAETTVLEGCQMFFGAPCKLVAINEQLVAAPDGKERPARDMPRLRYAGAFDPEQVPTFSPELRKRDDVAGYRAANGPKAAAIHPWGRRLFIVRNAASQRAAEEEALATCNGDPTRRGADGLCFLYAVADKVVLPQRSVQPMTTATDTDALTRRVNEALTTIGSKDNVSTLYARGASHKAIAVQAETGRTYRWSNLPSREFAEERVLELCQLRYGTPCVLLAADAEVLTPNLRKAPKRDMPRLHYDGPYRPDQVPFHIEGAPELADYVGLAEPKAMAIHSSPRVRIASGATLAEAEAKALAACNDADPAYPCFLYARNMQVVLPQRRTEAGK